MKLEDWLMAEATRRCEETADRYRLDDDATRGAARSSEGIVARIVARARARPEAARLEDEIERALAILRWSGAAWLVVGAIAGAAAAANLRTGDNTIALSYALLALLGIPLLLLLLSLAIGTLASRRGGAGLPGRLAWRLARRPGGSEARRHLAGALAELGRIGGRPLMAAVTHGFWTAFFAGCIAWTALQFLGLRFDFSWETTLLTGPWVGDLIVAIGTPPAWLFGLPLPDSEQVTQALVDRSAPDDRRLWAGYLISCLVLYGLLPRAALAAFSLLRWRRLRLDLDLGRTGYLRLLPALAGSSAADAPSGAAPDFAFESNAREPTGPASAGGGPPVAIGFELGEHDPYWPPEEPEARILGRADDREQRRQIERALGMLDPRPAEILVFASLGRTPDRGTGRWLSHLERISPVRLMLLPPPGRSGRDDADVRRRDWEALCRRFGLAMPRSAANGADRPRKSTESPPDH